MTRPSPWSVPVPQKGKLVYLEQSAKEAKGHGQRATGKGRLAKGTIRRLGRRQIDIVDIGGRHRHRDPLDSVLAWPVIRTPYKELPTEHDTVG